MKPLHYAIFAALALAALHAGSAYGPWWPILILGLAWAAIVGPAMARWAFDYWRAGGWFRACVLGEGPVLAVFVLGPAIAGAVGVWL